MYNVIFVRISSFSLFEYLIRGIENQDLLLTRAFFALAKTFLGFRFEGFRGGRNNTIVISQFMVPDEPIVHEFRQLVWEAISTHFSKSPDWAFECVENYARMHPDVVNEIMQKDISHVITIIEQHLTPDNFLHCRYVHKQIRWCKRHEVLHDQFSSLAKRFTNPLHERYLVIDWDRFRDKESFEFDNCEC